jgi:hypothetical protein
VIEIFDTYRDEAAKAGRKAGPDDLCIRRQVIMHTDKEMLAKRQQAFHEFIKPDPRADLPGRPAALDSPSAKAPAPTISRLCLIGWHHRRYSWTGIGIWAR